MLLRSLVFLSFIAGLVTLTVAPAYPQSAGREKLAATLKDWITVNEDGCGRACMTPGKRRADQAPSKYGQHRRRGVNSGDAFVIETRRIETPRGFASVSGAIKDGQDQGTTKVEVLNYAGEVVFSKFYDYKGPKANAEVQRWTARASDVGQTSWRAVSIRYTMTERPGGNRNGITVWHNAEPGCQTSRAQLAARGAAPEKASPPVKSPTWVDVRTPTRGKAGKPNDRPRHGTMPAPDRKGGKAASKGGRGGKASKGGKAGRDRK